MGIFNYFKHKAKDKQELPKIGELWLPCFKRDGDPWNQKVYDSVTIIDVLNGWVRYDMGKIFRDERMEIDTFVKLYKRDSKNTTIVTSRQESITQDTLVKRKDGRLFSNSSSLAIVDFTHRFGGKNWAFLSKITNPIPVGDIIAVDRKLIKEMENKMHRDIKVGDKVKRVDGRNFLNGEFIATVDEIRSNPNWLCSRIRLKETVNYIDIVYVMPVEIKKIDTQFEIGDEVEIAMAPWVAPEIGIISDGPFYSVKINNRFFVNVPCSKLTKVEKPKYDKETIEALIGSIKKWEDIILGKGADEGSANCPLCKKFILSSCDGCPVKEKTGRNGCSASPWTNWFNSRFENTSQRKVNSENIHLAYAELDFCASFIKKLLVRDTKEIKNEC